MLAFDLLQPEEQSKPHKLLKSNPRFAEDFAHPGGERATPIQLKRYWIGRAGYWPDVARRLPEFNRPKWHYQLGASLVIGENVNVPETPGPLPDGSTLKTKDLHIAQAIELCRGVLQSSNSSDSDKALAICWIAHLVADAHQPCRAGSLYMETVFPNGDRGANSIPTKQGRNLHALWDSLLGRSYDAGDIERRCQECKTPTVNEGAARRANDSSDLQPEKWLSQSALYAKKAVYRLEVLNEVEAALRSGTSIVPQVDLSQSYLQAAGTFAKIQAVNASHRLAAILKEDLGR